MTDKQLYTNNLVLELLRRVPVLSSFSAEELRRMLYSGRFIRVARFARNDVLMEEGDTDTWVYILVRGGVRVIKAGAEICTLRRLGDVVGEMGPLSESPRTATVKAINKTVCIGVNMGAMDKLPHQDRVEFLRRMHDFLVPLMNKRIRINDEAMELLEAIHRKKEELRVLRERLDALGVNEEKSTLDMILEDFD